MNYDDCNFKNKSKGKKYDLSGLIDYVNSPPLDKKYFVCSQLLEALYVQYMMGSIDEKTYEKESNILLNELR